MKTHNMLTTREMIFEAERRIDADYAGTWKAFERCEPELADFIESQALETCGKMGLCGWRPTLIQGVQRDMCQLGLIVSLACRRGEYELWKDTVQGTRLGDLWRSLHPSAQTDAAGTSDGGPISGDGSLAK